MKTTDLSKYSKCIVRQQLVVMTPEEGVRQLLLQKMIQQLGFPKSLISVEKMVGSRRYDIVCFTQEMIPILLVECKAQYLNDDAISQAIGYNYFLNAPFVCIAAGNQVKTFWQGGSAPFLPTFKELYDFSRHI